MLFTKFKFSCHLPINANLPIIYYIRYRFLNNILQRLLESVFNCMKINHKMPFHKLIRDNNTNLIYSVYKKYKKN